MNVSCVGYSPDTRMPFHGILSRALWGKVLYRRGDKELKGNPLWPHSWRDGIELLPSHPSFKGILRVCCEAPGRNLWWHVLYPSILRNKSLACHWDRYIAIFGPPRSSSAFMLSWWNQLLIELGLQSSVFGRQLLRVLLSTSRPAQHKTCLGSGREKVRGGEGRVGNDIKQECASQQGVNFPLGSVWKPDPASIFGLLL